MQQGKPPPRQSQPPSILFRDRRFVVIDKPAGLKVHAGPGGGGSVEDMFPALGRFKAGPWLAHRLDADTAGCLAIALKRAALHAAQAEFAAGRVRKTYWAVVRGRPAADHGTIDLPLAKRTSPGGWRMVVDPAGLAARTDWRVLGHGGGMSWLELVPHTGRTHQVRIHCASLGCPLLGDRIYGPADMDLKLHLLARAIVLDLDPEVRAVAAPPDHMRKALGLLGLEVEAGLNPA